MLVSDAARIFDLTGARIHQILSQYLTENVHYYKRSKRLTEITDVGMAKLREVILKMKQGRPRKNIIKLKNIISKNK